MVNVQEIFGGMIVRGCVFSGVSTLVRQVYEGSFFAHVFAQSGKPQRILFLTISSFILNDLRLLGFYFAGGGPWRVRVWCGFRCVMAGSLNTLHSG